jgi:hypothetical protein
MAEYSRPWGGVAPGDGADAGPYTRQNWWDVWGNIMGASSAIGNTLHYEDGVLYSVANGLAISYVGDTVTVECGASLVDGTFHYNDDDVDIDIPAAAAGNVRVDMIVVRKNYQTAVTYNPGGGSPTVPPLTTRITRIVGAEVATPGPASAPALTNDTTRTTYWDIPLIFVDVSAAGVVDIADYRKAARGNFYRRAYTDDNNAVITNIKMQIEVEDDTGAAGLGVSLDAELENDNNAMTRAGRVEFMWTDPTDGGEDSQFMLEGISNGAEYEMGVLVAPSTTSVDGNDRGIGAVDFQQERVNAAEVASGAYACVEGGSGNTASGNYSHAEAYQNDATGDYSHAEGYINTASGDASHAEGASVTASGDESHAEGAGTQATGDASHAEGNTTTASAAAAHAEGFATSAGASYAHAEGTTTTAIGTASHAEGGNNDADGDYSHAEGRYTTSAGDYSHSGGTRAYANEHAQMARAGGRFAIDGDSQYSDYPLFRSVVHNDASWYSLYLDGTANIINVAQDQVMTFSCLIAGTTQGCTKSFSFKIEGLIENDGGTTSILASTVTTIYDTDDVSFDAQAAADNVNDALLIQVQDTDGAGDTVRWMAVVRTAEVMFPA